jgi:tetratricopeptide (TPR) repeat protein
VLGPGHPDTIAAIDAICEELFNLRKYEEARELLEEELLRCKKAFGLEHQLTIRALSNMGNVYKMQGKLQDACSVYGTALDVSERVLGKAHQITRGIRKDLQEMQKQKTLYETQNQRADTLELRQALAAIHGLPIPADPFTTTRSVTSSQLADMYHSVAGVTTAGPEVAAATALRLAETTRHPPSAPVIIPPYSTIEAESTAVPGPSQNHAAETAV